MRDINLEFLNEKKPVLDTDLILKLEPLTPLSIVRGNNGSARFYKANSTPTYSMLLGLVENILEYHFDFYCRSLITKNKKKEKTLNSRKFETIINKHVELDLVEIPKVLRKLVDLSSFQIRTSTMHNMQYNLEETFPKKYQNAIDFHIGGSKNIGIKSFKHNKENIFNYENINFNDVKEFIGALPHYYSSIITREYMIFEGNYTLKIKTTNNLAEEIIKSLSNNNMYYLGNSESIINVTYEK